MHCADEPEVPAVLNDKTNAAFLVALIAAGQDCRSALQYVREWHEKAAKAEK